MSLFKPKVETTRKFPNWYPNLPWFGGEAKEVATEVKAKRTKQGELK